MPVIDDSLARASMVKAGVAGLATSNLSQWNNLWDTLWGADNPDKVLEHLGKEAAEIFKLNDDFIGFFESILSEDRQEDLKLIREKIAAKPNTITKPDGSVIIGSATKEKSKKKKGKSSE